MSINKKLLIFVVALIVVPMLLLFFISTSVLDKQIEKSAQSFLENALKIGRNRMLGRLHEMNKGSQVMVESEEFQQAVLHNDSKSLASEMEQFKKIYDYADFIIILDENKNVIASFPELQSDRVSMFEGILNKAYDNQICFSTETVFNLDELYHINSEEYNKFKVKVINHKGTSSKYFTKCLAGMAAAPVIITESHKSIQGYFIVGDIVNNDDYYPQIYSASVKESYLALSVDGIRLTSNIQSPTKRNYIGSKIPISMDSLEGPMDSYFGYVNFGDEIHVFLDEPILDYKGDIIGVLGVGIPEHKFWVLIETNRKIIFWITFTCLVFMMIIGRQVSLRITRPIMQATKCAESIVKGELDLVIDKKLMGGSKSETAILLKTFQKMANDLKDNEEERKQFLEKLKKEHEQQQLLTHQLKEMNDELEERVEARTKDLRLAIKALKKADEVKSQFLANMSHELRTPLNAIICSSEVLADKIFGFLNEKQDKYIQNILNSGKHLLQVINDILDISKIEAGKMTLALGTFLIADIVTNSLTIVKSLAYRKNIEVQTRIVPENFTVKADAKKIMQIFYNLLSNSIKFTPDNGKVEVEVYKRAEFMQVIVKDNGIGIKVEDQDRVFCEFEQVDSSYEKFHEGTGLGLPLTKKLVEMHGGEIYLKSKDGQGTEVIFTIPIDTEGFLAKK